MDTYKIIISNIWQFQLLLRKSIRLDFLHVLIHFSILFYSKNGVAKAMKSNFTVYKILDTKIFLCTYVYKIQILTLIDNHIFETKFLIAFNTHIYSTNNANIKIMTDTEYVWEDIIISFYYRLLWYLLAYIDNVVSAVVSNYLYNLQILALSSFHKTYLPNLTRV